MKNERYIYDDIYTGLVNRKEQIKLRYADKKVIDRIYNYVILDNPLLFYVKGCFIKSNNLVQFSNLIPQFTHSESNINKFKQSCVELANKIVGRFKSCNEWTKVLLLHDLFVTKIKYADGPDAHNIVGALLNKEAVCEGIAKAFKFICDMLNIESVIVAGQSNISLNQDTFIPHAWNKVKINNIWANIDVTFDMTLSNVKFIRHDYFCVPDSALSLTHKAVQQFNFNCTSNQLDYYKVKDFEFSAQTELKEYIKIQLLKEQREFEIKLVNAKDHSTIEADLLNLIVDVLSSLQIDTTINIYSNIKRCIFTVELKS